MSETLTPTGETNEQKRYPWPEWLDGKPRRLVWGVDFEPEPTVFRTYAYAKARKAGLKLAIVIEPTDNIVLQSYHPGKPRPLLPSPWRRKANGRVDNSAPDSREITRSRPAGSTCRHCDRPLSPASAEYGECRKFSDPAWRCPENPA